MASFTRNVSSHSQSFAAPPAPLKVSQSVPSIGSRVGICDCKPWPTEFPPFPIVGENQSMLTQLNQPMNQLLDQEADSSGKIKELVEETRNELQRTMEALEKLKLIDTLQRLGIGYLFEEDINTLLAGFVYGKPDEDLHTTALRFRLLRHNGYYISPDIFEKFTGNDGKFKESLKGDVLGLLSLYEASYLGAKDEVILSKAMEFSEIHLRETISLLPLKLGEQVSEALELPRHRRMARLEAIRYIKEYGQASHHNLTILELAKLYYNKVQSLHHIELAEVKRWWKHLGLVDKLTFARDRPLECFLWAVGILPHPKYSSTRIELSKTIAILLVIDDIYDTYGKMEELLLFTNAIQRWDLNAMEELPDYMKICYMALYNTTNEICYKILKEHGWNVLSYLKSAWIDMIEGFMIEAKWLNSKRLPNLEEYIKTSVSTAGAYMALTHLFFLIGQGVTDENLTVLTKPYPRLFSSSGKILRLWDDLGTSKEEQERGGTPSSIQLHMKENNIETDSEARMHILQMINGLWKELNGEFISQNVMPMPIISAAFNMARASQVVYQHEEDNYFSSVDNYVQALFFTPAG